MTREEVITERYVETVGLHIGEGRGFRTEDRLPGARTSIINETMAKRFFANGSPLGRRWFYGDPMTRETPWTIIGVVRDATYTQVRGPLPNIVYHIAAADPDDVLANLELRTVVPQEQIISAGRNTLAETESSLPVYDVIPLAERMNRGLANDRLVANLTAIFGGIALLLACLGLYGTISHGVARRIRELGVRMALGAARNRVLWLVIREAIILILAGAT